MMQAWKLYKSNGIQLENIDYPLLNPDEVRVKVAAVGISDFDVSEVYSSDSIDGLQLPVIPGHEFSGIVEGLGKDVAPYWMHRRVAVYPLIPCMHCHACQRGRHELCQDAEYIGMSRNGAFAEYVNVPAWNLFGVPDDISSEAAAMISPMAEAVHAIRKGTDGFRLPKDSEIAVLGSGTIGQLITMFLLDAGYHNLYVQGDDDRGNAALSFVCAVQDEVIATALDVTKEGGTVILTGVPDENMRSNNDVFAKVMGKHLTLCGSWGSSYTTNEDDDWYYVLERLEKGRIHPERIISHRLGLAELEKGLHIMRDKSRDYGKVMVGKEESF